MKATAGSKLKAKARRHVSKTKKLALRFLRHGTVHWVLELFLLLGMFYFAIAGILTVALRTDSYWMAVISPSMMHEGERWRIYFENETTRREFLRAGGVSNLVKDVDTYDTSKFPIQGGFERGDLLIIQGVSSVSEITTGDVLMIDMPGTDPLTHRVLAMWEENGKVRFTTKGDHNDYLVPNDRVIEPERVMGKVVFVIPKLGHIALWFRGR